jgi:CHAT domain-containing protein
VITRTGFVLACAVVITGAAWYPAGAQPQPTEPSAEELARLKKEYTDRIGKLERLYAEQKFRAMPPLMDEAAERMRKAGPFLKDRRARVELAFCWYTLGAFYEMFGQPEVGLKAALTAETVYDALIADGQIGNEAFPDAKKMGYTNVHHLNCLHRIGMMYLRLGEPEKALPYVKRAADAEIAAHAYMTKKVGKEFPNYLLPGRVEALGLVLFSIGRAKEALPHLERAASINEVLYTDQKRREAAQGGKPKLDPVAAELSDFGKDLATNRLHIGLTLAELGRHAEAKTSVAAALKILTDRYPADHPTVIYARRTEAALAERRNDWSAALEMHQEIGKVLSATYPARAFPDGHPDLAENLDSIGSIRLITGRYKDAVDPLRQSFDYHQKMLRRFASAMSESEALAFLRSLPTTRDKLLTALDHVPDSVGDAYAVVWQSKGHVTRILRARHLAAVARLSDDKRVRADWEKLIATRRQIAQLMQEPADDLKKQEQEIDSLTRQKEELERALGGKLASSVVALEEEALGQLPAKLLAALPADHAFVDVVVYKRTKPDGRSEGKYAAFVMCRGAIQRVELGAASEIDAAAQKWRRAIADDKDGGDAEVHRLVWEKIKKHVPAGVTTLYVCPDGGLASVPWWALPGSQPSGVLLDDFSGGIAFVSNGQFLLDQLTRPKPDEKDQTVLAVGAVNYGTPGTQAPAKVWPKLDSAAGEIEQIGKLAGTRKVVALDKDRATARAVADALRTPNLTHIHLATHAQFDEVAFVADRSRSTRALAAASLAPGPTTVIPHSRLRSPLAYTSLVLAGANSAPADGYLSGEEVAALPLGGVRLAVLSACETGLGSQVNSEGVFGLQRAWHMAGSRDVVASLWRVDDAATTAVMAKFYHEMWAGNRPPLAALREAQLTVRSRPELIEALAGTRGPLELNKAVKVGPAGKPATKADVRLWAAFGLSGLGR